MKGGYVLLGVILAVWGVMLVMQSADNNHQKTELAAKIEVYRSLVPAHLRSDYMDCIEEQYADAYSADYPTPSAESSNEVCVDVLGLKR